MTLTHLDLDRIEGLAKAATPGPWYRSGVRQKWGKIEVMAVCCDDPKIGAVAGVPYSDRTPALHVASMADAAFIALGPETTLALITRIRELEGALDKLRSYSVDIEAGRINYRPLDHIAVADAALQRKTP